MKPDNAIEVTMQCNGKLIPIHSEEHDGKLYVWKTESEVNITIHKATARLED